MPFSILLDLETDTIETITHDIEDVIQLVAMPGKKSVLVQHWGFQWNFLSGTFGERQDVSLLDLKSGVATPVYRNAWGPLILDIENH